ncbi:MAG: hypothetical protein WBC44_10795 [Planctomycetaceae bacterium]
MTLRQTATVLTAGGLCGAAFLAADELPSKAPPKLPAPVVNTHELMEIFNEPLYEHLKQDMASQPADDEVWSHIKHQGIEAAEIANLIAIRKVSGVDQQEWITHCRDAQQSGLDLAHAAAAKDWNKAQASYKDLITNCNDCHTASGIEAAPQLEP